MANTESGLGVSWTINTQVKTYTNDVNNPLYFGEGEAVFRMVRAREQDSDDRSNIPVGVFRTLADANAYLEEKPLADIGAYYALCGEIEFVGFVISDSPKENGSNDLTLVVSREYKTVINYWGAVKNNDRLWFVLDLRRLANGSFRAVIVPVAFSHPLWRPSPIANHPAAPAANAEEKTYDTIRRVIAEEKKDAPPVDLRRFARRSMYAGKVNQQNGFNEDFEAAVPQGLLMSSDRKSDIASVDRCRFNLLVGGRPDFR